MIAGPAGARGGRGLLPVALGLLVGASVVALPVAAPIAVLGLGLAYVGLSMPAALVGLMFLAMLFDQVGLAGVKVASLPVTASKLAVLGSLGLWAAHSALVGRPLLRWHPVLGALLGMVAAIGISTAVAGTLWSGIFDLAGIGMLTVLVGLVYTVLTEERLGGLYRLMGSAFVAVLVVNVGLARASGGRSTGTMGDPNEWASMVLLLSPFLLGGLVHARGRLASVLRLGLLCLPPAAVLASQSRAALLVLAVVFPLSVVLMRRRRAELGLSALAGVVALPMVLDLDLLLVRMEVLFDRVRGAPLVSDGSLDERTELWRQGWELFGDHWFIGVGPGNFGMATEFVPLHGHLQPAHNTYLQVASEQGVVGLAALAVFGLTVVRTLWLGWRHATSPVTRSRVAGVALGLLAVATMAATLGLLTMSMAYLVLGFGLAVCWQDQARWAAQQAEVADAPRA